MSKWSKQKREVWARGVLEMKGAALVEVRKARAGLDSFRDLLNQIETGIHTEYEKILERQGVVDAEYLPAEPQDKTIVLRLTFDDGDVVDVSMRLWRRGEYEKGQG